MRRMITAAMAACLTGVSVLSAQPAGAGAGVPGRMGGRMGGPLDRTAEFLLSQTGELRLTDAQVTRLAAIARRSAERRRALRQGLDSLRPQFGPGAMRDSATRARLRERAEQMRPQMEKLREQAAADRRDAIAVLTPEQQAQAWERVATMGRSMRAAPGRSARGMGLRRGSMRQSPRGPMDGARPGRPRRQ